MINRIEHSVCNRRVMGSNPSGFESHQGWAIFHFIRFRLYQEQLFTVENGAVARARLAFRVLAFANKDILLPSLSIANLLSIAAKNKLQ